MTENDVGEKLIGCAITVHRALGPGLLESVYEECLAYELAKQSLRFARQQSFPVIYDGHRMESTLRLDLVVEDLVVVEVKAAEQLLPIHEAQLLTYLRLGRFRLGYLLNFNVKAMKDGIRRMVRDL